MGPHRSAALALLAVTVAACAGDGAGTPPVDAGPRPRAIEVAQAGDPIDADVVLEDLCQERFAGLEASGTVRVGLLTDSGTVNDGTFNQFAYEGMEAAARCFGLDTTYVASGGSHDHERHLDDLVDQGVDAVITVGFPLSEATAVVSGRHPEVAFIGIDQTVEAPERDNYVGVTFRDDQAGFLAGAVAGLLTESGTVGVVAGPDDVPPVVALADGFEAGVASVDDATVLRTHLPSFSDQPAGAAEAEAFHAAGADVVYAPAGLTGSGAILRAAQLGAWVVGVDQDQYLTTFEGGAVAGADRLATSTVKRVDLGVFLQLADLTQGTFEGGQVVLDVATGGVTYAPPHEAELPTEIRDLLEVVRLDLADDAVDTTLR